jgi:hypothetical protein
MDDPWEVWFEGVKIGQYCIIGGGSLNWVKLDSQFSECFFDFFFFGIPVQPHPDPKGWS